MAFVKLDTKKLKENFQFLNNLFKNKQIQWAIVSKVRYALQYIYPTCRNY